MVVLVLLEVVLDPEPDLDPVPEADSESVSCESEFDADAEESSSVAVLEAESPLVVWSLSLFPELVLSSSFGLPTKAFSSNGDHHDADTVVKRRTNARRVLTRPEALIVTDYGLRSD